MPNRCKRCIGRALAWALAWHAFASLPGAAAAATLDLRADCHAAGDNRADDSQALQHCLTLAEKSAAGGHPSLLRIPPGIYRIGGAAGAMPVLTRGVAIAGDGPHAATLRLDDSFAGDLLAWDEAWTANTAGPDRLDLAHDATGPSVTGLRITGNRAAQRRQNALTFYDRNDHVLLRDVEVDNLNGDCLSIGRTRRMPEAYLRESAAYNLKCFGTGSADGAAVSIGSTARPGSDATNELDLYKLAVFDAAGQGVAVRNPAPGSATRGVRFYGLRVEKTVAEGLAIGEPGDRGQVEGIFVSDLTVIQARGAALRVASSPDGPQPYGIRVSGGSLGPGNTRGIEIDNGRLISITLDTVDASVVLGPNAGADIEVGGNGAQSLWRFTGTQPGGAVTDSLEVRSPFNLRGLPGAGDRVGVAALRAALAGGADARLTMDGGPPTAYNCFNMGNRQVYSLGLRVVMQDLDRPERRLAWSMPTALASAWSGAGSAHLTAGPADILQQGAAGGGVTVTADTVRGCLALSVHAPAPAGEHWSATALITYARAP